MTNFLLTILVAMYMHATTQPGYVSAAVVEKETIISELVAIDSEENSGNINNLFKVTEQLADEIIKAQEYCKGYIKVDSTPTFISVDEPAEIIEEIVVEEKPTVYYEEPLYEEPVNNYEEPLDNFVEISNEESGDGCVYISTYCPWGGQKDCKYPPANLEVDYSYTIENGLVTFSRTGTQITESEFNLLCNMIGSEYGSAFVPTWERAICVEVTMNRVYADGCSIYSAIANGGYVGCGRYLDATEFFNYDQNYDRDFGGTLSADIRNSVVAYFNYPEYFNEGYLFFEGHSGFNWFRKYF